jgi:hypothetical protein
MVPRIDASDELVFPWVYFSTAKLESEPFRLVGGDLQLVAGSLRMRRRLSVSFFPFQSLDFCTLGDLPPMLTSCELDPCQCYMKDYIEELYIL